MRSDMPKCKVVFVINQARLVWFLAFLILVVSKGEGSASHSDHFTIREKFCSTFWVGGWVSPRNYHDFLKSCIIMIAIDTVENFTVNCGDENCGLDILPLWVPGDIDINVKASLCYMP